MSIPPNGVSATAGRRSVADGPAWPADLRQVRLLAEHLPQLVWTCLPDGSCDFLNRRWVDYTGVAEGDHHGLGWLTAIHPDDRERTGALYRAFIDGRADYDLEYRLRRHDGAYRWFKTRGLLLRAADGSILRVFGTCTDIDAQKRAEEELREAGAILRGFYDTAPVMMGVVELRGVDIVHLTDNAATYRFFGAVPDSLAGKRASELGVAPDHLAKWVRRYREAERTGRPVRFEYEHQTPAGPRWVAAIVQCIERLPDGRCRCSYVAEDVTDRKRMEERLREAEDRAAFVRKSSGVGFWYCDLPFDVLEWDEQTKAHFHLPPDARVTIGTFYDRIHPDDREPTRRAIERSIAGRTAYDVDYRTVDPATGAVRWVRALGRTFYGPDGTPRRFDGVTIDVTTQKRAEEELRESRERLEAALAASGTGTFRWDLVTNALDWDAQLDRLFGLPPGQTVRSLEKFVERVHPDDRGGVIERCRRCRDEGVDFHMEFRVVFPDGSVRWLDDRGQSFRGPDGRPAYMTGACVDITERKRAEAELRENEGRLRAAHDLLEGITEGTEELIVALDPDFRFTACNAAYRREFARVFGTEARVGASLVDALAHLPEDQRAAVELWGRALAGEHVNVTAEFGDPGRARRVFDLRFYPLRDAAGRVVGAGETARDVTDRVRAEAALKEADQRKDDFIALLAHELRNPLAPIRNGLQVLRLAADDPAVAGRAREMMERQLGHMVRLVDDLLDVSRISRNKMELRRARVRLRDVVSAAVETARPAIEAGRHEFATDLPPDPVLLDADLTRLAQVFANLLTNSAKYTPTGGRIRLVARRDGSTVTVTVTDTGIGIPSHALPTIFDMFSQVDRSIERTSGGLGIGLALVKGLVEMHGGTVTAASDGPGRGSTFTVRLPVLAAAPEPAAGPAEDEAPSRGPGRRVLVADDNRDSADSMAALLTLLGHQVRTAHDGLEAVATAQAFRPDLVLMDVGMPRLNGYDATRRIREQPWGRDMTVVALTGWGQDGDRASSRAAGCDGHLVKPVELVDLQPYLVATPDV